MDLEELFPNKPDDPLTLLTRQDLDPLSIDELHTRIATLETEIERFVVAEYDGVIMGCAALYAFPEEKVGELAALAVHPDFRREGYGEALMAEIEARARRLKLAQLFVLTTRTSQWFLERGYAYAAIDDLPQHKQALYNFQRKSQVYSKDL